MLELHIELLRACGILEMSTRITYTQCASKDDPIEGTNLAELKLRRQS